MTNKSKNSLANDMARCNGSGDDIEGWREGCETCLRRTAPRPEIYSMFIPPSITTFDCVFLIEPSK